MPGAYNENPKVAVRNRGYETPLAPTYLSGSSGDNPVQEARIETLIQKCSPQAKPAVLTSGPGEWQSLEEVRRTHRYPGAVPM